METQMAWWMILPHIQANHSPVIVGELATHDTTVGIQDASYAKEMDTCVPILNDNDLTTTAGLSTAIVLVMDHTNQFVNGSVTSKTTCTEQCTL